MALAMRVNLAVEIEKFIKRKKLTQTKAAAFFDVPQPKISKIISGKVSGISIEYLVKMAAKAGFHLHASKPPREGSRTKQADILRDSQTDKPPSEGQVLEAMIEHARTDIVGFETPEGAAHRPAKLHKSVLRWRPDVDTLIGSGLDEPRRSLGYEDLGLWRVAPLQPAGLRQQSIVRYFSCTHCARAPMNFSRPKVAPEKCNSEPNFSRFRCPH